MALTKPAVGSTGWGSSVNQNWSDIESAFNSLSQGRLTLTSGTPVTTSNVTGASTIYFTPYNGAWTALYDGTNWRLYNFSEISLALSGLTSGKNYDVFLYDNSGTLTLILGPAWSTDTSRGTGAGTTELVLQDGVWVNKQDLSGGPTAKKGRYLGTIRTTGTTTTEDSDGRRFVWNNFNRKPRWMKYQDSTSHTYGTSSYRYWNNSSSAKVEFVVGQNEEYIAPFVSSQIRGNNATYSGIVGYGLNTNTSNSCSFQITMSNSNAGNVESQGSTLEHIAPVLGYNYVAAVEYSYGATAAPTFLRVVLSAYVNG